MAFDERKPAEDDYWAQVRRRMWIRDAEKMADRVGRGFGLRPGKTPAESYIINERAFAKAILAMQDRVPAEDVAKAHATLAKYPA